MPFEQSSSGNRRIAVIGGGISGMGAAYGLAAKNTVVVFEAENRLGGHARTLIAGKNGDMPVDTGFLVYNEVNYPNLTALFEDLAVETIPSDMSFGCSIGNGWLEYGVTQLPSVFAQKRNIVRPKFLSMVRDILKFNAAVCEGPIDPEITIDALTRELGLGDWFRDYYLYPFTGAIWSTPTTDIGRFPAAAMIQFMRNHALVATTGQHQWRTVKGGSVQYVTRMAQRLRSQGVDVRLGTPVAGVRRVPTGVEVRCANGEWEHFDDVVMATHSDISLRLLSDATTQEKAALGDVLYQPNEVVLHCDRSLLPKRQAAWGSWNYIEDDQSQRDQIGLTYYLNRLQSLPKDDLALVTMNPMRPIKEACIWDTATFHHPVFDAAALRAQKTIAAFNGDNNTWFCGAWMKNGFHEDGLSSAFDVVARIQARRLLDVAAE